MKRGVLGLSIHFGGDDTQGFSLSSRTNKISWLPTLKHFYFLLLFCSLFPASGAWAQSGTSSNPELPRIGQIKVEGNSRIENEAILDKMSLKTGDLAEEERVRADILSIFSLGFFEDIRIEQTGAVLSVVVRERPLIREIKYEGAEEFDDKELGEATGLKAFEVVNLSKIRAAQAAISKKYEEKGYYLARADFELVPVAGRKAQVDLHFRVQENEQVRIRRVFFNGNENFSAGDLKQVMITTEGHVFSWATGGGTYREDAFERDLAVLAYFYGNEGYIQARFAKPRVSLSEDRRYIDIFIDVDEGKQFFLGSVKFSGDLLFSEAELAESFEMGESDVFSTGKLQEEILKLTDKYGDKGYAFANVIPRPEVRPDSQIVDLAVDLEKGEKVYWGKITVSGNTKTHDKVLRRELPFAEGELYSATKRKKGLERVRRLGFFGNDVNFLTSTPEGSSSILDLDIKVDEKPTGSLNVSAGFGTGSGFTFQGQVSQNNLFGRGQQLSFNLTFTEIEKVFSLSFTDPKAFDTEWSMGGDLYYQDGVVGSNPKTYDREVVGGSFRMGQEIRDNLSLFGTYKLANSKITDPISVDIFTDPVKDPNSTISSVAATMSYDTRNNRIDPSGGKYLSASSEFAGLGGRVFQKMTASARAYYRPFWKFTLRTNVEYGLLANFMSSESVPVSERYVLGGIFSLRGYPISSIGPGKTVTPTRADAVAKNLGSFPYVIGGTQKFVFNQELEFPLIPEADIRLVAFFDAGNTWDPNLPAGGADLYSNYGWGIRWYSPLGPLRFEWGYPLQILPSKGDKGTEFHFIIAPTF